MNWALVANASWPIKIHLLTVIPAVAIGAWQLFLSVKGSHPHRVWGFVYLALMAATAVTTLFIYDINPGHFSAIHLLVPVALASVVGAIWFVKRGRISTHRNIMIGLYVGGIIVAGGFTFVPGRLLHRVFFG